MNCALFPKFSRYARLSGMGRLPAGYHPGATLQHVQRNFEPHLVTWRDATHAQLHLPDSCEINMEERVQRLFMAHIVTCPFHCYGPLSSNDNFSIEIKHTGLIRRSGVCFKTSSPLAIAHQWVNHLRQNVPLMALLLTIDFRRCQLTAVNQRWTFTLEHFAASDVVSRLPPSRRYLPLLSAQRKALLMSMMLMRKQLTALSHPE